jgi:hypothetical protein
MRAPHHITDIFHQHFHLLSSGIGVLDPPKKDLGTSVATPRVLGIEQRHRQSNPPSRDNFLKHHHLYIYLWAYFRNSAFWPKTPNSVSLAGTAWLETSGVVDDDSFRLTGNFASLFCLSYTLSLASCFLVRRAPN